MQVQVTKGSNGVKVWHIWVDITHSELMPIREGEPPQRTVWIKRKLYLFKKCEVFSAKFVKKHFPTLGDDMAMGDCFVMDLKIEA